MWTSFRSSPMGLYKIFINKASAYAHINGLTEASIIQICEVDGDHFSSQRKREYVSEYRRCSDLEAILHGLVDICDIEQIEPVQCVQFPETPKEEDLPHIELEIKSLRRKITTISIVLQPMKLTYFEKFKMKNVFDYVRFVMGEENVAKESNTLNLRDKGHEFVSFEISAGLMPTSKVSACEKTLWRIGRGHVLFRYIKFEEEPRFINTADMTPMSIFIVLFQGYGNLKALINPICVGYGGLFIDIAHDPIQRSYQYDTIVEELHELERIIEKSLGQFRSELMELRKDLCTLVLKVKKMKMVFQTLNMLKSVSKMFYVIECWIPVERVARAKYILNQNPEGGAHFPGIIEPSETTETPPTLINQTKFTKGFQAIINAYGIPAYQEMNPTPFTIITFPFLFAIMFGDIGHGLVVVALTTWVIIKENSLKNIIRKSEISRLLFAGRYMILMMGIFSIYVGFVYNNMFSRPIKIFCSSWKINYNASTIMSQHDFILDPTRDFSGTPYKFGEDPVWKAGGSGNLPVQNAFKMKVSIIVGVIHMMFGICVGICNKIHFKDYASIYLESIPQLIFLCGLFFYLAILMFYKWIYYGGREQGRYSSSCAPLILITFINMVMFKKPDEPREGCSKDFYKGQPIVEKFLVITAYLMIPIMMCGKPLYIYYKRKRRKKREVGQGDTGTANSENNIENEEPMTDVIVIQLIHTIESVLGSVSHTASYLRLWALALAHEQLSEVIWSMVLTKIMRKKPTPYYGGVILFFTFGAWALLSLAILILMEGLSAFLHTLRLHWIEFQSRFYKGGGYKFEPLSFDDIYQEEQVLISGTLLE